MFIDNSLDCLILQACVRIYTHTDKLLSFGTSSSPTRHKKRRFSAILKDGYVRGFRSTRPLRHNKRQRRHDNTRYRIFKIPNKRHFLAYCTSPKTSKRPNLPKSYMKIGDTRLELLKYYLANTRNEERGIFQIFVHKWLTKTMLPFLYKECWYDKKSLILEKHLLSEAMRFFMVKTARRMGKSESVAMFAASKILVTPGFKIAIFAQNSRAARTLISRIKAITTHLMALQIPSQFEKRDMGRGAWNAEKIEVWHGDKNDANAVSTVSAFPSTPESCKGQGFHLGILEEAALIPQAVLLEGVVPMFTMEFAAVCAISTPKAEDNGYSLLLNAKDDDGSPLFMVLDVELICDECKASSTDSQLDDVCEHRKHVVPPWKTSAATKIIKNMYAAHPKLYQQEILGSVVAMEGRVYNIRHVDRLRNSKPVDNPTGKLYIVIYHRGDVAMIIPY